MARVRCKVRQFQENRCVILSSFKIMIIFNNTSADFVSISADVILKKIIILKEPRITQLCSKKGRSFKFLTQALLCWNVPAYKFRLLLHKIFYPNERLFYNLSCILWHQKIGEKYCHEPYCSNSRKLEISVNAWFATKRKKSV